MLYSKEYISQYARFLIILAWTVEIIAVVIGLTISIVVAVSAYQSFAGESSVGLLDGTSAVLVASLPFVLIAVVEVCKIPLTFAFMVVQHVGWRSLFMFFVLFLCLITFETMFNGFERNFSNLNRAIDGRKNEIMNARSEIELLEKRRDHIIKFTEEDLMTEVDTNRGEINEDYKQVVTNIDRNTRETLSEIDYSFKEEIEKEITRLLDVRDVYYKDWAAETEEVENRFSVLLLGNISGSSEERDRLLSELNELKADFQYAMDRANFLTRSGVESKYRALIKDKEDQLATVTSGYLGGEAIEKQSTMEAQLRQQLEFINSKYAGRIEDINQRIENHKQEIVNRLASNAELESSVVSKAASDKARFARIRNDRNQKLADYMGTKLDELEVIAERSFGVDEGIFELNNRQRQLDTEINHLINQNQIYRLAMYAYDKEEGSEVERGMIGTVALIWFGSLSLIASVCGVMLALAGFYLRRFDVMDEIASDSKEAVKESP